MKLPRAVKLLRKNGFIFRIHVGYLEIIATKELEKRNVLTVDEFEALDMIHGIDPKSNKCSVQRNSGHGYRHWRTPLREELKRVLFLEEGWLQ